MKQRIITSFFLGIAICMLFYIPDLHAPEITERDMFGFDTYRVAEGGAILDADGVVRGWITKNAVYDAYWNIRYHIHGNRHHRADKDLRELEGSNGKT